MSVSKMHLGNLLKSKAQSHVLWPNANIYIQESERKPSAESTFGRWQLGWNPIKKGSMVSQQIPLGWCIEVLSTDVLQQEI